MQPDERRTNLSSMLTHLMDTSTVTVVFPRIRENWFILKVLTLFDIITMLPCTVNNAQSVTTHSVPIDSSYSVLSTAVLVLVYIFGFVITCLLTTN